MNVYVGSFFVRQPEAPLKQYLSTHYKVTNEYNSIGAWGKASVVFSDYGSHLITSHPFAFAQYYLWLSIKNYFLPPLEKLEIYNLGMDSVLPIAQYWFGYKSLRIRSVSKGLQGTLLFVFPPLFFLFNLYFIWNMLIFGCRYASKVLKNKNVVGYWLISAFITLNFGFTVLASINVFRYQFVPMIVSVAFTLLLMEWLDEQAASVAKQAKAADTNFETRRIAHSKIV